MQGPGIHCGWRCVVAILFLIIAALAATGTLSGVLYAIVRAIQGKL